MKNGMRHLISWLAAAVFIIIFCFYAAAQDVKVVANPSVKADSISALELRSVFLAETNSLRDGSHVEPVFERTGAVHETFLKTFLKESNDELQSHYGALVFTGKASMPKAFNSDADVVAYVAKTRGAIGYVSASTATEGVKVLEMISEGGRADRALLTRIEPEYPDTLRQLHIGGTVRLLVTISPQGKVDTVTLLGGNPILGDSAIKALRQWVYAPSRSVTTIEVKLPFDPSR